MIVPTQLKPTFILSVDKSVGMLEGNTSLVKIWNFEAFMVLSRSTLSGLVPIKPFSMEIVVMITEIRDRHRHDGFFSRTHPNDDDWSQRYFGKTVQNHKIGFKDVLKRFRPPQNDRNQGAEHGGNEETEHGFFCGDENVLPQIACLRQRSQLFPDSGRGAENKCVYPVEPGGEFPQQQKQTRNPIWQARTIPCEVWFFSKTFCVQSIAADFVS